jgi:hypothetical protein
MNCADRSQIRYVALAASLLVGTIVLQHLANTPTAKARRSGAKLPPGPKQEFLIGNLRNFPKKNLSATFSRWKKEFGMSCQNLLRSSVLLLTTCYVGDVIYANLVGKTIIILGSLDTAEELLIRRASNYSGRPFLMMSEL